MRNPSTTAKEQLPLSATRGSARRATKIQHSQKQITNPKKKKKGMAHELLETVLGLDMHICEASLLWTELLHVTQDWKPGSLSPEKAGKRSKGTATHPRRDCRQLCPRSSSEWFNSQSTCCEIYLQEKKKWTLILPGQRRDKKEPLRDIVVGGTWARVPGIRRVHEEGSGLSPPWNCWGLSTGWSAGWGHQCWC